ncbi:MAG: CpsD/CapB family tyrosine-protein kinase [Armatimonadota bacterium]
MLNLGFRTRRAENAPQIKRDLQLAVLADITSARHGIGTVSNAYDKLYDEIARRMPRGVTFAVTSAERAEGRTSIAASLACAAVRQGKTVLLIDADLRRPQLHELFAHTGLTVAPGLVEMLVGNLASPSDAVHETSIPGLSVVPAGRMQVSDASALLESPTMQRMLKSHLPQLADIIIIDTPPVQAGEAGSKIIHQADGVIIALRVGHSQMPSCKSVLTALQRSGARVIGGVLVPAGEPNTGPILAHVETPDVDPASLLATPLTDSKAGDEQPHEAEPIPVIHIVAGPPSVNPEPVHRNEARQDPDVLPSNVAEELPEADDANLSDASLGDASVDDANVDDVVDIEVESVSEEDIEDVVWVSTNDTQAEAAVVSFGDDATHRDAPADIVEPGEPTVADDDKSVDDTDGTDLTSDSGAERDETATMDDVVDGANVPADKLSELLATWRRGAYDVAITQPVATDPNELETVPVVAEQVEAVTIEEEAVAVEADNGQIPGNTDVVATADDVVEVTSTTAHGICIEALEVTFSMVPTGTSEMTLRAASTNHGELGCPPIYLEMAMLVSAMRGMQAETPGPDATDGLRALLETKSSNADDNTALRLRVGSMDAPRIDATLHADGICLVRAGETRGDTQISISAPDGGTSTIVATTSLTPMEGRAVITLEREVLRRPYGDVRFVNRIRLQLMK